VSCHRQATLARLLDKYLHLTRRYLLDPDTDTDDTLLVPSVTLYVRSTKRIFVRINIWNQLGSCKRSGRNAKF
jgi:hypothetical protein